MADHRPKRPSDAAAPPAAKRPCEPSAPTFPTYKDAPDLPPKIRLLCEILASSASDVEAALDDADVRVTSSDVEQVLRFSYARRRRPRHLRHQHSPYSWNLFVDLLGKNRLFKPMWDTVSSMRSQGLLSLATFASVFSSLAANPASSPLKAFVEMPLYGMERHTPALNSLLSALCRASRLNDARAAIPVARAEAGTRPDADSYAILLEGCEAAADPSVAREVFDETVRAIGLDPTNVPAYDSFLTTLVSSSSSTALPEALPLEESGNMLVSKLKDERLPEACKYAEDMIDRGIELSSSTLSKLKQCLMKVNKGTIHGHLLRKCKAH